jgi:F-type H+-transporting ATPase subunit delta
VINTTLAKRYAKALVEIGQEHNALEQYGADLGAICDLVEESWDFREVLINPVFTKEDKKRIAGEILVSWGLIRWSPTLYTCWSTASESINWPE